MHRFTAARLETKINHVGLYSPTRSAMSLFERYDLPGPSASRAMEPPEAGPSRLGTRAPRKKKQPRGRTMIGAWALLVCATDCCDSESVLLPRDAPALDARPAQRDAALAVSRVRWATRAIVHLPRAIVGPRVCAAARPGARRRARRRSLLHRVRTRHAQDVSERHLHLEVSYRLVATDR